MNLRRAVPSDASTLAELHTASWLRAYQGIVPDSYLRRLSVAHRSEQFHKSLVTGAEETYVAEDDGQILGFLTIGDSRDADQDGSTSGEIWGIYLSPQHWRKGVGSYLAKQGESLLVSRGRSIVKLWVLEANTQARRFFEAMGFELNGASKEVNLGVPLTAVRYCKIPKAVNHD